MNLYSTSEMVAVAAFGTLFVVLKFAANVAAVLVALFVWERWFKGRVSRS